MLLEKVAGWATEAGGGDFVLGSGESSVGFPQVAIGVGGHGKDVGGIMDGDGNVVGEGDRVDCRSRWMGFCAWYRGDQCRFPISSGRSWRAGQGRGWNHGWRRRSHWIGY